VTMPDLLDIVGQDPALAQLQRLAGSDRRPHAFLFTGPEGVGRRTMALGFAQLLLCPSPLARPNERRLEELPPDFVLRQGCGTCNSCRTLEAGTNPDLHLLERQLGRYHDDQEVRARVMQELGIEVVRQFLIGPAHQAPAGGRGRVFIVREAELLSIAAQNALLKTLEEPPAGVTLILICTSPAELLPTTRSRCQTIRFRALPASFVAEALINEGVDPAEARLWAAVTDGSLGRARQLAAGELHGFTRALVDQLAALSPAGAVLLAELLHKAMEVQAKRLRAQDAGLAASLASRQAGGTLLALLASIYRDALAVASAWSRPLIHADQAGAIGALARRLGPARLADILTQLARHEQLLWRNVNPKTLWDNVAATCAAGTPLEV